MKKCNVLIFLQIPRLKSNVIIALSGKDVFSCSHDLSLTQSHPLHRFNCYNEHLTGLAVTHWARRDKRLPQPGRHSKPQCYQTLSNLSPWDSRVFLAPTWPVQTQCRPRDELGYTVSFEKTSMPNITNRIFVKPAMLGN